MMNTMSNNKLNIDELEMANGGGLLDVLVEAIGSIIKTTVKPTVDVGIETLEDILRYPIRPLGSP